MATRVSAGRRLGLGWTSVLALALAFPAHADEPPGRAVSVSGKVLIRNEDTGSAGVRVLRPGDPIEQGSVINTDSSGSVKLLMSDRSIVDLGPSSLFKVDEYQLKAGDDRKVGLSLAYGKVRASVNTPVGARGKFQLRSRSVTMGVRGTEFVVLSDLEAFQVADQAKEAAAAAKAQSLTQVTVLHGKVEVAATIGGVHEMLLPNQQIAVQNKPLHDGDKEAALERAPATAAAAEGAKTASTNESAPPTQEAPPAPIEVGKVVKLAESEAQTVRQEAVYDEAKDFREKIEIRSEQNAENQTLAALSEALESSLQMPELSSSQGILPMPSRNDRLRAVPVTLRVIFNKSASGGMP